MKWVQAKTDKQLTLNGVRIEVEHRDKSIFSITLTDDHGAAIKVSRDGSYGVGVYVPAPPEMKKVFELTGSIAGGSIPVALRFESKYQAESKQNEVSGHGATDLKIAEVEVAEDEWPAEAPDSGVPF